MRPLPWLCGLVVAFAGVAEAQEPTATLAGGATGTIRFESVTPTGYFELARGQARQKTVIWATLRVPAGAGRVPAMVIAHGSGGVTARENWWADQLGAVGVATFVVDSFSPRNIRATATDQSQLSTAANVADALAALRLLATHPRIDPTRIGIIGFSKGGQVALYTALEPFRAAVIADATRFALHVAAYPYCNDWEVSQHVTGAPLLLLLGARDDYTPAAPCRDYAQWFGQHGAEARTIVYPGAYHDFDTESTPLFARTIVTGRNCDMMVDLDRFTVSLRQTGADITATAAAYARDCLTRGATLGGDAEARKRAPEDVTAFLRQVFKLN